jgi:hypothetical protein
MAYYVKKEEFEKKIEDVSKAMISKARKIGIMKKYPVQMQIEQLKRNMTIRNVLNAINDNLVKYKATLYDIQVEVM